MSAGITKITIMDLFFRAEKKAPKKRPATPDTIQRLGQRIKHNLQYKVNNIKKHIGLMYVYICSYISMYNIVIIFRFSIIKRIY